MPSFEDILDAVREDRKTKNSRQSAEYAELDEDLRYLSDSRSFGSDVDEDDFDSNW